MHSYHQQLSIMYVQGQGFEFKFEFKNIHFNKNYPRPSLFDFLEKHFRKLVFDPGWLNERNASVFMKSRFIKTYFISITSENLLAKLKINIVYRNLVVLTLAALERNSNGTRYKIFMKESFKKTLFEIPLKSSQCFGLFRNAMIQKITQFMVIHLV